MLCPQCKTDNGSLGVKCYRCGADLMPRPVAESPAADIFTRDRFLLRQKMLAIKDKYYVHDENGNRILYVEREFLKIMPRLHFYTDDTKRTLIMSTESRPKSFFDYRLHLVLPGGQTLAVFKKDYIKGMFFQRYWDILDAQDNPIGKAQEDSIFWGLVRRYVPYGDFMLTNFNFFLGDRQIGTFNRKFTIADKYVLDLSMDPSRSLDRRVAVALGVLLDTGEHR